MSNYDGIKLVIDNSLDVHRRLNPNDISLEVHVTRVDNIVVIEDADARISITFTLDEIHAIMRLFMAESEAISDHDTDVGHAG